MTNNLLAFVWALQYLEIPLDLRQLANNCKAPNWQKVQTTIDETFTQYPELKGYYDDIYTQLQTINNEELTQFLPAAEKIEVLKPKYLKILGRPPAISSDKKSNEIENLVVEIAVIILQDDNPSEMSKELLPKNPQKTNPEP